MSPMELSNLRYSVDRLERYIIELRREVDRLQQLIISTKNVPESDNP